MCKLKTVLAKRKLTIASFARISGMSGSTIGALCSGRHNMPHQDTASKVAAALGMTVAEIWPNLELHKTAHAAKLQKALLAYNRDHHRQSKPKPAPRPRPVRVPDIRLHPSSPNAVPLADGASGEEFRLRPAPVPDELLQNDAWCAAQARRMHEYIVRNCAYGVYRALREVMAAENQLFEERAKCLKEAR
jgi:transcriptional regulator with XRE-family HTH domain